MMAGEDGSGTTSGTRRAARAMLRGPLRPGTIDDARSVVQLPIMTRMTASAPLTGTVLDAGSGRSGLYDAFIDGQPDVRLVEHIDLEPPTDRDRPGHRYTGGSLCALPFDDAAFDSAICMEVLEHIDEDALAVRELARVLRPGGTLLVSVPMPPAPPDSAHVREGYTVEELHRLLTAGGFEVVATEPCMRAPMRFLFWGWRLQSRVVFGGTVAYVPAPIVRGLARLDRRVRAGRPFDVVVAARRRSTAPGG